VVTFAAVGAERRARLARDMPARQGFVSNARVRASAQFGSRRKAGGDRCAGGIARSKRLAQVAREAGGEARSV